MCAHGVRTRKACITSHARACASAGPGRLVCRPITHAKVPPTKRLALRVQGQCRLGQFGWWSTMSSHCRCRHTRPVHQHRWDSHLCGDSRVATTTSKLATAPAFALAGTQLLPVQDVTGRCLLALLMPREPLVLARPSRGLWVGQTLTRAIACAAAQAGAGWHRGDLAVDLHAAGACWHLLASCGLRPVLLHRRPPTDGNAPSPSTQGFHEPDAEVAERLGLPCCPPLATDRTTPASKAGPCLKHGAAALCRSEWERDGSRRS